MWFDEGDDEAERLFGIALHEAANAVELMVASGIADAVGVEAADVLKRKRHRRLDVHLAGDAHSVAQRAEVVRHAFHTGLAGGVIPGTAIVQRVLSGHQLGTARLAHRLGEVGAVEGEPLAGQSIDIRGPGVLAAVQWEVVVRAVVGHDDQEVGLLS